MDITRLCSRISSIREYILSILSNKEYSPEHKRCIRWNDGELGIPWPIKEDVILSEKDRKCLSLREAESNFQYPI